MSRIIKQRMAAEIDGEFVVFLIGARFNKPWKLWKYRWFLGSMPAMLRELEKHPEAGLLGYRNHFGPRTAMVVQYWRSFDHLEAYARSKDAVHFPNWVRFNKEVGSNGDVGIWHETYKVASGQYEAIYHNMPAFGLGKATALVPAAGYRRTARGRIEKRDDPYVAEEPAAAEATG